MDGKRRDFFVSYTATDSEWAEWIAWQLEDAGYTVLVQAWDMVPGSNWLHMMHQATKLAERTIAVLSKAYLTDSAFGEAEWLAAYRRDPSGLTGRLIPIRVEDCTPDGLLAGIVYTDLVGQRDEAAKETLLRAVRAAVTRRSKPLVEPGFPGADIPISNGPAGDPSERSRLIELSLQNLGEADAHHVFERICFELTRARIAEKFRYATTPIGAGGDQGRDGETYWTDLPDGPSTGSDLVTPEHAQVVMACTLEKEDIPTKIKRDIEAICSRRNRVGQVVYFISHSLTENSLHELQDWASAAYGIGLIVWDGQLIARTLSDPDLWFMVERYLKLPLSPVASQSEVETAGGSDSGATISWLANSLPDRRRRALGIGFFLAATLVASGAWITTFDHLLPKRLVYRDWSVQVVADECGPGWKSGDQVARSVVDLDGRRVRPVPGSGDVAAAGVARDLTYYIDCPENRPRIVLYAGSATLVDSDPTWQQCESAVPLKRTAVTTPSAGLTICSRTQEGAVALIRVREMEIDGTSATLAVTLWR